MLSGAPLPYMPPPPPTPVVVMTMAAAAFSGGRKPDAMVVAVRGPWSPPWCTLRHQPLPVRCVASQLQLLVL